jgi:hypothetical protein
MVRVDPHRAAFILRLRPLSVIVEAVDLEFDPVYRLLAAKPARKAPHHRKPARDHSAFDIEIEDSVISILVIHEHTGGSSIEQQIVWGDCLPVPLSHNRNPVDGTQGLRLDIDRSVSVELETGTIGRIKVTTRKIQVERHVK